mmetsp:Transcript_14003/g.21826  ORF Transcript_14003/g.21826 Transcript_14003/m.21826 type:complete len:136 (+) Transcript_14003:743-1150(+)
MNRIVYDSVNPSEPQKPEDAKGAADSQADKGDGSGTLNIPTANNCDNDARFDDYYKPQLKNDYTLCFESRFESGNLRRAIQVYVFEYDLILKPDYLTKNHSQWFYFRLKNTKAGQTYRFNIINLLKPDSLYNHGM